MKNECADRWRTSAPKKCLTQAPARTFPKHLLHPSAQKLPHPHLCARTHAHLRFAHLEKNIYTSGDPTSFHRKLFKISEVDLKIKK